MLKQYITDITQQAIKEAVQNNKLGEMSEKHEFTLNAETQRMKISVILP